MYIYMYIHNIYIYIYTYLIDSSTRQFRQNSVRLKLLLYSQLRHIALLERAASIFGTWASKRWGKFTFFEHKNGGWNMIFHGFSPLSIWENEVPWCSMSMFFSECKILKWTCFLVPSFFSQVVSFQNIRTINGTPRHILSFLPLLFVDCHATSESDCQHMGKKHQCFLHACVPRTWSA